MYAVFQSSAGKHANSVTYRSGDPHGHRPPSSHGFHALTLFQPFVRCSPCTNYTSVISLRTFQNGRWAMGGGVGVGVVERETVIIENCLLHVACFQRLRILCSTISHIVMFNANHAFGFFFFYTTL